MNLKPDERQTVRERLLWNRWFLVPALFITNVGAVILGMIAAFSLLHLIRGMYGYIGPEELNSVLIMILAGSLGCAIFVAGFLYLTKERSRAVPPAGPDEGSKPPRRLRSRIVKFVSNVGAVVSGLAAAIALYGAVAAGTGSAGSGYSYYSTYQTGMLIWFCISALITLVCIAVYFHTPQKKSVKPLPEPKAATAPVTLPRICKHCGSAADGDSQRFCTACGQPLDAAASLAGSPDPAGGPGQKPATSLPKKRAFLQVSYLVIAGLPFFPWMLVFLVILAASILDPSGGSFWSDSNMQALTAMFVMFGLPGSVLIVISSAVYFLYPSSRFVPRRTGTGGAGTYSVNRLILVVVCLAVLWLALSVQLLHYSPDHTAGDGKCDVCGADATLELVLVQSDGLPGSQNEITEHEFCSTHGFFYILLNPWHGLPYIFDKLASSGSINTIASILLFLYWYFLAMIAALWLALVLSRYDIMER